MEAIFNLENYDGDPDQKVKVLVDDMCLLLLEFPGFNKVFTITYTEGRLELGCWNDDVDTECALWDNLAIADLKSAN